MRGVPQRVFKMYRKDNGNIDAVYLGKNHVAEEYLAAEWLEGRYEPMPCKFSELRLECGLVVHFEDGSSMLVGNLNESGGVCSCCEYDTEQLVVNLSWLGEEWKQ